MRVLAVDPAIRNTGYAIVEGSSKAPIALDYGTISIQRSVSQSKALAAVKTRLYNLIQKWEPDEVAIEGIIFVQSYKTAIAMGAARASALIAAADCGVRVYEYAPKKVKLALAGNGNASKDQVAFMARVVYKLRETPDSDAADALAIAYANLTASDPIKGGLIERKEL